eukprot:superscaffoldBa00001524_g10950
MPTANQIAGESERLQGHVSASPHNSNGVEWREAISRSEGHGEFAKSKSTSCVRDNTQHYLSKDAAAAGAVEEVGSMEEVGSVEEGPAAASVKERVASGAAEVVGAPLQEEKMGTAASLGKSFTI